MEISTRTAFFLLGGALILSASSGCGKGPPESDSRPDWLLAPASYRARVSQDANGEIVLANGLIRRSFVLGPNAATVEYRNEMTGEAVIRAVRPEARLEIEGVKYDVGGLVGQEEHGYFPAEWLPRLRSDPKAFQFKDYEAGTTTERFPWKRSRYSAALPWPPPGASLILHFQPPPGGPEGLSVSIHYEIYDGIPLLCKWLSVRNNGREDIALDAFAVEILAAVEAESSVNTPQFWGTQNLHVESDYAFLADTPKTAASITTRWLKDPLYESQINWLRETPCLLESRPPLGPGQVIKPGGTFETFRTFELVFDSTDRERKGLSLRRMYRTISPWVTENPIFMHLRSADPDVVRTAVDQCADTGFEMLILSFGSGLDMENSDAAYLEGWKKMADYAHSRGVEVGGYSLLASRRISEEQDVVNPKTGKTGGTAFGNSPCLGSEWADDYFKKLATFFETTGFDMLEHDGSYPGDVCASAKHPGHRGTEDSQWNQWRRIAEFYKWCRGRGIYLNVPDWYFLNGSNKCAMGYRETNWSLPRDRQVILGRQNIYDGTWEKTPSMGWMFLPLVQYHGGGEAATIEPLSEHLDHYEAHLAQNFGAGVQACYRGTRLYDSECTKAIVKKWVDFYKKYRAILDSDIIHLRRPDGRDFDGFLHVNPQLQTKGLAVFFNPTGKVISKKIRLPLYYTGLRDKALLREQEGKPAVYRLDRSCNIHLTVNIAPHGRTWYIIE